MKLFLNLFCVVLIPGLTTLFAGTVPPIDPARYNRPVILACVGDSITADRGPWGYPTQLSRMLKDQWEVKNFGVSGSTLMKKANKPYQNQAAFQEALASKADVVIIMLGTNDSKPVNWAKKDQFVEDYKDLIRQFKALESKPVILIAKPPYVSRKSDKPDINEEGVRDQLPMIDKIAAEEKVSVVDIHGATFEKNALFRDGVHPNGNGAGEIARTFYLALTGKAFEGPIPTPPPKSKTPVPTPTPAAL